MLYLALIATGLIAVAALLAAGYLYGQNKTMGYLIVEGKRRERRQIRDLAVLHNKFSEKAGMGSLTPKKHIDTSTPQPQRRFVSPSQAISEMIADDAKGIPTPKYKIEKVPPATAHQFLTNVGTIPAANNKE